MESILTLKVGELGEITGFKQLDLPLKFAEMGLMEGNTVEVLFIAPFKDPIAIKVCDYVLALRKSEAAQVWIKKIG